MGLNKPITEPSTVVTEYHRLRNINGVTWNEDETASVNFAIESFINAEARNSGASPLDRPKVRDLLLTDVEAALVKKVLYTAIHRDEMFSDAQDIIGPTDPDMTPLVDVLLDWEVQLLEYKVRKTMEARSITPLTDAEVQAIIEHKEALLAQENESVVEPEPTTEAPPLPEGDV